MAAALLVPGVLHAAPFAQIEGQEGCAATPQGQRDVRNCAPEKALRGADSVVVAPDGKNIYVASRAPDAIVDVGASAVITMNRDIESGGFQWVECISDNAASGLAGTDGDCRDGDALASANAVTITADSRDVYVSAAGSRALAAFRRQADGRLEQTSCFQHAPTEGRCRVAIALSGAADVVVSPDDRHVYVAARSSNAIAVFTRDERTGDLTQSSCISDNGSDGACTDGTALLAPRALTFSPDGNDLYVAAAGSSGVLSFRRDGQTGALTQSGCILEGAPAGPCQRGRRLSDPSDLEVSPDGRDLYVTAIEDDTVSRFSRDPATGTLTQEECINDDGAQDEDDASARTCVDGFSMVYPTAVEASPDGRSIYVLTAVSNSLNSFDRDPATGVITETSCVGVPDGVDADEEGDEPCDSGRGLEGGKGLALSADGRNAYVAADENAAVTAFALTAAVTTRAARLSRHGAVKLTVGCPAASTRACRGRVVLRRHDARVRGKRARAAHRRLGSVPFVIPAGGSRQVTVRLDRRTRRAVRRSRRLTAEAVTTMAGRHTAPTLRRMVLRTR